MQKQKIFFGANDPWHREEMSHAEKLWKVDRSNPESPFSKFIGNEKAVNKLQVVAFDALGKENHVCREMAFSIFGPPSSGKTTLVKLFANVVELPFIEFGPQIKSTDDMVKEIDRILYMDNIPLIEFGRKNYFELPPCVIFIDEIHAVCDKVIQALLKATEYNDGFLVTEKGKTINCENVCWMIATTDEGMLFDAFRSRFSPLVLTYLTDKEISTIVKKAHSDLPDTACDLIAYYNSRVPRKALEFARYVKLQFQMLQKIPFGMREVHSWEHFNAKDIFDLPAIKNLKAKYGENFEVKDEKLLEDWVETIESVRWNEGIDEYGMSEVHAKVLKSLCKGPIAMSRMPLVVGRKKEEVSRYIMPWLMTGFDALVKVTSKGYDLTDLGRKECIRRGFLLKA